VKFYLSDKKEALPGGGDNVWGGNAGSGDFIDFEVGQGFRTSRFGGEGKKQLGNKGFRGKG